MASITARPDARIARAAQAADLSRVATIAVVSLATLAPLALAFAFRHESLRLDEAQSLWQVSRPARAIIAIVAGDVHVPLYHLLLHAWLLAAGDTVAVARLLSLLFFVASVPLVYLLGERAYGRRVALFAVVLFALSPFMNWYASEIRMYTMLVFFTVLNQYCFLRLAEGERGRGVWAFYGVSALLGAFTHYFFFLNLLAEAVYYLFRRERFAAGSLRRFASIAAMLGLAFIPWAWYVFSVGTAGFETPALAPPSAVNLFGAFAEFFFGFQSDAVNTVILSLWPVTVILGVLALRRRRMQDATEYLLIAVLVPFAIAFFGSFVVTPVFVSRYLIATIPALCLLVANLLAAYPPSFAAATRAGLVGLVAAGFALEVVNPLSPVKEEYASAVAYLSAHASAQDAIVLSAPFTVYPVEYYYRGPATISTLPAWDQYAYGPIPAFDPAKLPAEIANATAGDQDVYLLLSYDQGYESKIRDYFESHYQRLYEHTYSHDLTLYVYRLRYDTNRTAIATARS
ncbi:MAG: glycosyltransferase family 39 protein [Patescibacteria group bacterium]|nr:glycosyltransferase family 39 protein [Patescibacteria group bacterium]MDE1944530.1 glycosyltransferase family 39 protein [Patescibacteria group bacterium]MDE1944977.1 glycosyltransferase family 39 protein [Patescibacteria group bacterium]MDE2057400.1 glycosyltransferase family 39 protein [Patescibacteria group bacterium]